MEQDLQKLKIEERNDSSLRKHEGQELSSGKRQDYLPWEDYFMAVAFLSAMRSKDPSTQVSK